MSNITKASRTSCPAIETFNERILVVIEQVPIDVEGGSDVLVTHASLDLECVRSLGDHESGGGVPQLVEVERIELSRSRNRCPHSSPEVVVEEMATLGCGEYPLSVGERSQVPSPRFGHPSRRLEGSSCCQCLAIFLDLLSTIGAFDRGDHSAGGDLTGGQGNRVAAKPRDLLPAEPK